MQIDTAAAIDLSKEKKQNESSFSDQMKAYIKHPGSGVLALLTLLGAVLTFALLFFLIGYILVKGVPYLSTDLFSLTYNSENLSLLPSLINTFILTVVSLVIAAPLGIFAAIYLVEYAKKGSKLVNVIRISRNTFRNSFYCIWPFRYAVFRNSTALGTFSSVRCFHTGDHDSSSDHAYCGRSPEICS